MRTWQPDRFNEIANREDVRPNLGGLGPIDLGPALLNARNYAFECTIGGFVLLNTFGTVYEAHSIFAPERRGVRPILDFMSEVCRYMFVNTDCTEITTKVPEGLVGADFVAKRGNFKEIGTQKNWDAGKSASLRSLPLDAWLRTCYHTLEAGRTFHAELETAKRSVSSTLETHEDDELHDRMAGAAYLMAKAGNVVKGVNLYNQWATFFGYRPLVLLSEQPAVVDIHDAVLSFTEGKMEILLCR